MCEMHVEIPKFDVAPIVIRYRVTGVYMARRIVLVAAAILHLNDFDSCSVLTGSLIVIFGFLRTGCRPIRMQDPLKPYNKINYCMALKDPAF